MTEHRLTQNHTVGNATILGKLQLKANYNIALGKTGEVEIKDGANAAWKTITGAKANAWQVSAAYFF